MHSITCHGEWRSCAHSTSSRRRSNESWRRLIVVHGCVLGHRQIESSSEMRTLDGSRSCPQAIRADGMTPNAAVRRDYDPVLWTSRVDRVACWNFVPIRGPNSLILRHECYQERIMYLWKSSTTNMPAARNLVPCGHPDRVPLPCSTLS